MFQGSIVPQQRMRLLPSVVGLGLCLSFTLFFFWPHPPASLLLLALAAGLAWVRLEVAVALLPLTFPFYLDLQPVTPSGSVAFSLAEMGVLTCLALALVRQVFVRRDRQATRTWLHLLWKDARQFLLPAGLFLLGASLAVLVSPNQHESLRAYREEVIEPLLYFLLISRYLQTRADLARAVGAFVLSALLAACMGIIQGVLHLSSDLLITNVTTFRVDGPYGSPNNLAFLVSRTLPILLALALLGWRRVPSAWRDPLRWCCLLALVPLAWALYWTGSRGAEAALLALLCIFFVYKVRRPLALLALAGAGVLALALFWSRLLQLLSAAGHGLISERLLLWTAALLIIRDHLFLGTGLDSFNTLYKPTAPHSYALQALGGQPFPAAYNPHLSHPHDVLLDFWVSTGVLGVVALCWLLWTFGKCLARSYRLCALIPQGGILRRLLLGIAGSMLVGLLHGLVDNFYFVPDLAMLFWFLLGMALVLQRLASRSYLGASRTEAPGVPSVPSALPRMAIEAAE
ncbi:MAG TPA: O-antigen ligase family protein [Ktedonobacterales bacterium]|nr:O-antigen ligase family protein [Ktedonobacterales bacterium]